ncbi:murein biosynthesis integral membrane protein MurJ [Cohnella candidum]|uniref:Murein biosynthesis integral membrane protein MurJ n=1 Tax=Cohnella candidum TaxID=2674991 RepID=A0A3G3K183_9BACL|nr:murein biosynthesis integral membrane protein MurJ [Cohnella candidum]AYQ73807.1 murein biosynthesis integral membrane protein MurJ [Cohnella candidum]
MNSKAIVSGAVILFVGNLLSSFLGLFREVLLAAQYGADVDMDSYLFANAVPSILLAFVTSVFLTGFIPLFIKARVHQSAEEASLMFSNTVNWFIVIILGIIGICYAFSSGLSAIFADNPAVHEKVEHLLWILLPGMLFFGLSYAQSTVLNSLNHFTLPALLSVLNNIVVIVFMVLFHQSMGIYSVAVGYVLGNVLQVVVQIPVVRKKGVRYRFYIRIKDEYLRKLLTMSLPIITLVLIDQTMVFASRYFSAYLDAGSASAINYANRILMLPVTLFGTAMVSATYPSAVQMWTENKRKEYNTIVSTGIKSLLLILIPIFFFCMLFATNIVQALLERGAFDEKATRMTSTVFLVLSAAIVIMPVRDFFNKLFFSRGQFKTPITYSLIYTAGFVTSCFILVPLIGYIGIAVSTIGSLTVSFAYLVLTYKRLNKGETIGIAFSYFMKIVLSAGVSSGLAYGLYWEVLRDLVPGKLGDLIVTVLAIGAGFALYFVLVKMLKVEEVNFVWNKLSAKFQPGRRRAAAEG